MRRAVLLLFVGASACGTYTGTSTPGVPNVGPTESGPQKEGPPVGVDRPGVTPEHACDVGWDVLEPREIRAGLETAWDLNRDGVLEEVELEAGMRTLPEPMRARIAALEAQAHPTGMAAFRYWDRDDDGLIEEDELTRSMIASWDVNGDGVVDPSEWPV